MIEFFKDHPNQDIEHDPVVDWVTEQRVKMGYNPPRDVWRMVRQLHADGMLVNLSRGVYKYDPDYEHETELQDFPQAVKEKFSRGITIGALFEIWAEKMESDLLPIIRNRNRKVAQIPLKTDRHSVISITQ